MRLVTAIVFVGVPALASCSTEPPVATAQSVDADLVATGRDLVVRECAACHAIERNKISPRPDAPPMSTVLSRYDPERLTEDLIEGVRVGHDDMPHFDFNVIAADAVVAYLKSIESKD